MLMTTTSDRRGLSMLRLRAERIRRDETGRQLAKRTGIPAPVISAIETGKQKPWGPQRKRLAAALGIPEHRLLDVVELRLPDIDAEKGGGE